jgi:branched-subunit amino acid transport protein
VALGPDNLFFWAALPTLLVAWKTRSLFGSVVVGMILVAAARYVFG